MSEIKWTPSQLQAIEIQNKSIAVSAAAGSGKTAVLTKRIIKHICDPDRPADITKILVVTFTTEAARQLMTKIADALSSELALHPDNAHLRMQAMLLPSAKISTIDSFCLQVVRNNLQNLDIPAKFIPGSQEEMDVMAKDVMDELIHDCYENDLNEGEAKPKNFEYFASVFGNATKPDVLVDVLFDIYTDFSTTIYFLDGIRTLAEKAEQSVGMDFMDTEWGIFIRRKIKDFCNHYEKIYADAVNFVDAHPAHHNLHDALYAEYHNIMALSAVCDSGGYREVAEQVEKCRNREKISFTNAEKELLYYKAERDRFFEEINGKKDQKTGVKTNGIYLNYFACDEEELKQAIADIAKVLHALYDFMLLFEKRFRLEKNRRNRISFNDMSRCALELLWDKENDGPTELAVSLKNEFDEIYVDEYQDTNEIQNKIFTLISKENNRFSVGDIKQSIYGFRAAEPSIFSDLLASCPKYTEGETADTVKVYLSENFRSTAQILNFCNTVFDKLMNITSVYGEDERLNCGSKQEGPEVEIYGIPKIFYKNAKPDDLTEPQFVVHQIKEMLQSGVKTDGTRIMPSDIAILLRSKSHIEAFEKELKKHEIPYQNIDAFSVLKCDEVNIILSFLTALDNPRRDIPLAATLKSPLYGVTLDELLFIRKSKTSGTLFDALQEFTEKTGFQKGQKFLSDLDTYSNLAAEISCDRLLWQIYNDFSVFSLFSGDENRPLYEIEENRSNLMMLYNYAREFEKNGYRGLSSFILFVNDLLKNKTEIKLSEFASPGEAIRIMTVHKSKGLEFPICFLCDMTKLFNDDDLKKDVLISQKHGILPTLLSESGFFRYDSPMRNALKGQIKEEAREEELRILYVALTRAKERLVITGCPTDKQVREGNFDTQDEKSMICMESAYYSRHAFFRENNWMHMMLISLAGKDGYRLQFPRTLDDVTADTDIGSEETEKTDGMTYYEAKKMISDRLDYEYPYKHMLGIPSKLSVSRLYPEVLDASSEGVKEIQDIPKPVSMPHFLMQEPDETATAAEKGTATHTFMQFCDFQNVLKNGSKNELDRLLMNRFLFASDADKIDLHKIDGFFASDLCRDIMTAKQIFREKRFMITFPAYLFSKEIKKELLVDEKLLVQGVIDCAFIKENGELVLVDYKTDSFPPHFSDGKVKNILRERHTRQLSYYAIACKQLFGKFPDYTYVYSFHLGDSVEIHVKDFLESENENS